MSHNINSERALVIRTIRMCQHSINGVAEPNEAFENCSIDELRTIRDNLAKQQQQKFLKEKRAIK